MKLALVSQEYPPQTAHGGIGAQTFMKAHGLACRGHQVHIISHSIDEKRHEYDDGPVRVTRIPGGDVRLSIQTEPVRWLTYSTEVARELASLQARLPLDVIDFPEWAAEGYVYLLNRTSRDVPVVLHLHGPLVMLAHTIGWPELDSELFRVGTAMEGTCVRLADAVFSSSRCSADWCARMYGSDAARIPVLHAGVDTRLFRPGVSPKSDRPTVIFVGKVTQNKGVEILVEAACRLAQDIPNLHLRLLGRGEPALVERLRRRAAEFPGLLDVPGFISRDELPTYLSAGQVFAAPSMYEGGPGFVYLEAMACGLPVIACAGSGVAEVVQHGATGLLVPPSDVAAVMDALRSLLTDRGRCQAMGESARRYVELTADSDECIGRLESLYVKTVEAHR